MQRSLASFLAVVTVAASLAVTTPARAITVPPCSPGLAVQMIAAGDNFSRRGTRHAKDGVRAYGIAENEVAYCLTARHAGTPAWKLRRIGLEAAEKRQRLSLAAGLPSARSERAAFLATVLDGTHRIAIDPNAPASVRSEALARYVGTCSAQAAPSRKAAARSACRIAGLAPVRRIARVEMPPKPSCAEPNVEPRVVDQVAAEYPDVARSGGITGRSSVRVVLAANGSVVDASVYHSSGNALLDASAVRSARASTYTPRIADCRAVPGPVLLNVDFTSG